MKPDVNRPKNCQLSSQINIYASKNKTAKHLIAFTDTDGGFTETSSQIGDYISVLLTGTFLQL